MVLVMLVLVMLVLGWLELARAVMAASKLTEVGCHPFIRIACGSSLLQRLALAYTPGQHVAPSQSRSFPVFPTSFSRSTHRAAAPSPPALYSLPPSSRPSRRSLDVARPSPSRERASSRASSQNLKPARSPLHAPPPGAALLTAPIYCSMPVPIR